MATEFVSREQAVMEFMRITKNMKAKRQQKIKIHRVAIEVEKGFCQCGCGQRTDLIRRTWRAKGKVKGEPFKFIQGHRIRPSLEQRLWEKVNKTKNCWEWNGATNGDGYGLIQFNRVAHLAHRMAWLVTFGSPGRMCVLHSCDNPKCVNPSHLHLGTQQDNVEEATQKGHYKWGVYRRKPRK